VKDTVLVTGGAGFIGSHLALRLAREGRCVRVLDNLSTGRKTNVELVHAEAPDRVDFLEGDIRNPATVAEAMRGVVEVFHQAALPSVERSVRDPWTSHEVNVDGTLRLLEQARTIGVRRFVLAGSSSVYGGSAGATQKREMEPLLALLTPVQTRRGAICPPVCRALWTPRDHTSLLQRVGPRQIPTHLTRL